VLTDGGTAEVRVDKASPAGGWRVMHLDISSVAVRSEALQPSLTATNAVDGFTDLPLAFLAGLRAVIIPFPTWGRWLRACQDPRAVQVRG
jgi:hypothetical protein